jgi:hypothetical protein
MLLNIQYHHYQVLHDKLILYKVFKIRDRLIYIRDHQNK